MSYKSLTTFWMIAALLLACGAANKGSSSTSGEAEDEQKTQSTPMEEKAHKVKISTSYGDMIVLLYNDTPIHRDNFLKLTKEGFYNDLLFHRVIPNFMIQGGDPDSRDAVPGKALGVGGPGYTLEAELNTGHFHKKGALAAARQGDQVNPEKRSSGSQFYIAQGQPVNETMLNNLAMQKSMKMATGDFTFTPEQIQAYTTVGGTPHLDGDYTVFGEVIEGLEVIDKIGAVAGDPRNRPVEDIRMTITILED